MWNRRKILFSALALLILFVSLEVISLVAAFFLKLPSNKDFYLQEYTKLYVWNAERVSHPYFGFVYTPGSTEDVNNMGFKTDKDFPPQQSEDEINIGFFGGSVALQAYKVIKKHIPENYTSKHGKKVNVHNFAIGSGKQPQQFFISSYFLSNLDVVINLDGFNELAMPTLINHPSDFPTDSHLHMKRGLNSMKYFFSLYKIEKARKWILRLPLWVPLLKYSKTYFIFAYHTNVLFKDSSSEIYQSFNDTSNEEKGMTPHVDSQKTINRQRLETWKRYTTYQHALTKQNNVAFFSFIQPNQFVKSSKPFSAEEKEKAIKPWLDHINPWYELLESEAAKMRSYGVKIYSLTDVFNNTEETVYSDNCCHINKFGNLLIAQAIAKTLTEADLLKPKN